jgi:hypothetical protein
MSNDLINLKMVWPRDFNFARKLWGWFLAPPPSSLPDEWAERDIRFDYSKEMTGPCSFVGRNYLRRPIRDSVDARVRKQTKVFGRGNGKTLCDEVQICYKLKFLPGARGLGVYPATKGEGGSENFVSTRLAKTIKASPGLRDILPTKGQERFYLNKKIVRLNGSHYGFIGSNSGSQGVSNRLTDIYFDEMEKFAPELKNEAGIDKLAEGSVEGVADYQIHYSSTPTIEDGLIWRAIWKSNLHLYFVPCQLCNGGEHGATEAEREIEARAKNFAGWFIILFSEQYSAGWPLKFQGASGDALTGMRIPFAEVQFRFAPGGSAKNPINDAKNRDGSWNLEKAFANAHIVCPHCRGAIRDTAAAGAAGGGVAAMDGTGTETGEGETESQAGRLRYVGVEGGRIQADSKIWMDRNGVWICVKPGEPGHVGYMINSLYAPVLNKESTWGGRAMAFLTAIEEGSEATRTFINAILAGVYSNQELGKTTIEISSHSAAKGDWVPLLTADFQKNWPYLWFCVRRWCAFKLLPPFEISNGLPSFVEALADPANEEAKAICEELVAGFAPAWFALAEVMRFDSRCGRSPVVDFLRAQGIVGEKLVKLFRDPAPAGADGNTMELRRMLYAAMGEKRAPRGGDSELAAAGYCNLSGEYVWDELREVIQHFQVGRGMPVPNQCVAIDCGYGEKFNREVLRQCFQSASEFKFYDPMSRNRPAVFYRQPIHNFCVPVPRDGWLACKGYPMNQRWNHGGIRNELNMNIDDPFFGGPEAGKAMVEILELPSGLFWLRKDDLRSPRTKQLYSVAANVEWYPKIFGPDGTPTGDSSFRMADYEKQLNEQFYDEKKGKVEPRHGRGGAQGRAHPYHLDDCETYQVALATWHGFFDHAASSLTAKSAENAER